MRIKTTLLFSILILTTPLVSSCASSNLANSEAVKTYNDAFASVNTVYGSFATKFRRTARENTFDTYYNLVAFNALSVPKTAPILSLLSPPDAIAMLCTDQANNWWVRGAMAPLSEISSKLAKIQKPPGQTGFSLLWAASRADLTTSVSQPANFDKLAEKAVNDCRTDYSIAFDNLSGGSGNKEAGLSVATLTAAYDAFRGFYLAADALAGQFGSLLYAHEQSKAFREFLKSPETKIAFDHAIATLKNQWKERNKINRIVAAESYVLAYKALYSTSEMLIDKYVKLPKPKNPDTTLKDIRNALKSPTSDVLQASDVYDSAFDVSSLTEVKALEKSFSMLVKRANNDKLNLDDLGILFADVKAIYEQLDVTIKAAESARAALRLNAN